MGRTVAELFDPVTGMSAAEFTQWKALYRQEAAESEHEARHAEAMRG